jgi:lysophospholipase L1-like esterase
MEKMKHITAAILAVWAGGIMSEGIRWEALCEPGGGGAIVAVEVSPHNSKHIISSGDMLSAAVSFDGGDSWTPAFGFPSYEMCSITFHPEKSDTVWMGTCIGPFKSTDGGRNWVSKRNGMLPLSSWGYSVIVEKILFDPAKPGRLLAFCGTSRRWAQSDTYGWVWESLNDGESWKHIGTIDLNGFTDEKKKGANIFKAEYEPGVPNRIHILADGPGWLISEDSGKTWKKKEYTGVTGGIIDITFNPVNSQIIWLCSDSSPGADGAERIPGSIYKSTDGGKTFFQSDTGVEKVTSTDPSLTTRFSGVAVSAGAPDELYANDQAWNSNVIYKSSDGGKTWRPDASRKGVGVSQSYASQNTYQVETACFAGISMKLVADPKAAKRIYGFSSEFILRTTDSGKTWEDATSYRPDPAKKDHWRGRGWNGWCSTDFGFNPYRKGQAIALAMDAGRGWISDNNLFSWRYTMGQTHPWLGGQAVSFSSDGYIYITTGQFGDGNGIQRSTDWGKTWTTLEGEERGLAKAGWSNRKEYSGVYVHGKNGKLAWAVLDRNLISTTDGGETWKPVPGITDANHMAGDPSRPGRFYVKTKAGILATDDGITFTNIGLPDVSPRSRINCDSRGRVLVCQWREGRTGVWRYTPETKEWRRLIDESQAMECNADPSDPTRLLLVTSMDPYYDTAGGNGVWISHDDGTSWSRANENLPMMRANACAFDPFDPEQVVVGLYGMGFFKARWHKSYKPIGERSYTHTPEDTEATHTTKNLLKNNSMTDGNDIPTGWDSSWGDVSIKRDTTVFFSSPASLHVSCKKDLSGQVFQRITGYGGKSLRLQGKLKTAGNAKINVALQSFPDDWSQNKFGQAYFVQGESDWTSFNRVLDIPDWADAVHALVLVEGEGKAWLDDVRLTLEDDAGEPTSLEDEVRNNTPPKGKPSEPAWCIYDWRSAWFDMHLGFKGRSAAGGVDIAAFGDSIVQGWGKRADTMAKSINPNLTAVNYGIGGDSTRQLIWRLEQGETKGINPRLIILGIGTNNLYGDENSGSDEEIIDGVRKVLALLKEKHPPARILILSILPRQNEYFDGRSHAINKGISRLADKHTVFYHDRTELFRTAPGKVRKELYHDDELHLVETGYDVWDKDLKPVLEKLLK